MGQQVRLDRESVTQGIQLMFRRAEVVRIPLSDFELEFIAVFKLTLFRDPMNGGRMAL
jgi:hypothetical protein